MKKTCLKNKNNQFDLYFSLDLINHQTKVNSVCSPFIPKQNTISSFSLFWYGNSNFYSSHPKAIFENLITYGNIYTFMVSLWAYSKPKGLQLKS